VVPEPVEGCYLSLSKVASPRQLFAKMRCLRTSKAPHKKKRPSPSRTSGSGRSRCPSESNKVRFLSRATLDDCLFPVARVVRPKGRSVSRATIGVLSKKITNPQYPKFGPNHFSASSNVQPLRVA